jgi:dienelactone hydrolase
MEATTNSFRRLNRSVYTWHGQDVPFSPWTLIDGGIPKIFWSAFKDKKYGLKRFMRYGYDHNPLKEESRIRVENMHADVLFLAPKDDDAWPSDDAVFRMVKVLKDNGYPYRLEWKIYDKASHALSDGLDELGGSAKRALKHMLPAEKKYPKECEEARQDSFRRVLDFLDKW